MRSLISRKKSEFYSRCGRERAKAFWKKFYNDPLFQSEMRNAWKGHKVNPTKIVEAAKLGYKALQIRYATDSEFKRNVDKKLSKSRSKGGAISLKNLGQEGFKKRLEALKNEIGVQVLRSIRQQIQKFVGTQNSQPSLQ